MAAARPADSGLLRPDLVIVECGAADGSNRLGTGQRVDAATADMGLIRMHRFGDQDAAAQTIEYSCSQRGFAARVAQRDGIAVSDSKGSCIRRMDHHGGCALARNRRWRLVETGIEK